MKRLFRNAALGAAVLLILAEASASSSSMGFGWIRIWMPRGGAAQERLTEVRKQTQVVEARCAPGFSRARLAPTVGAGAEDPGPG